jgi:hypothetical protein
MGLAPNFPCTQEQLYVICRMAWENYLEDNTAFNDFKAKYKEELGNNALTAVQAARNLPDEQTRNAEHEKIRVQLREIGDGCLLNWRQLKSYIRDVFPEGERKPMYEAAGQDFYEDAANEGWVKMLSLLDAGAKFIVDNAGTLSDGGNNMPDGFPVKFNNAKTSFENKYKDFLNTKEGNLEDTDAKNTANNALYDTLRPMLDDGQLIFAKNPTKRQRYVFDSLLGLVVSAGTTGVRVGLTEEVSELPVKDIAINMQPGNNNFVSNENGIGEKEMAENDYILNIPETELYEAVKDLPVKVRTGTMHRVNIVMKKKG